MTISTVIFCYCTLRLILQLIMNNINTDLAWRMKIIDNVAPIERCMNFNFFLHSFDVELDSLYRLVKIF